ncbi:NACHT, LRR and PYD domains-containing protein 3-like [Halichondria panicea]|uniref:NACHT, LRR and PYD domains-containing protein 3-like n=1 Tax=Halichondria panicea TaxID=6063 RepID=UPI00312BC765
MEESWSKIVKGELDRFPSKRITMDQIASKVEGKFSKLVVIKGAPGGGKTTLSWELCRRWANGEVWTDYSLVVLLRLRDENVQKAVELVDLFQCEDTDDSKNVYTIVRKDHGQGILFILEGLDELPPSFRENDSIFMKLITGRLLPASTVLVTTRPWAVCELPVTCSSRVDQFIEILGFSSKQIHEYIDLMIKDGAPPGLRKYIDSNPRISSAMYNPLHARIVVEVYRENHENSNSIIPNTTTELYTEYSQILIERYLDSDWSGELRELPSSLQVHFDKLCQIAYNGITKEKQQLVFFKEDVVDASTTLGFMNSVHPLYKSTKKSNSSPSYNFLHLTLQEFLAAFYIWKNNTPHEQLILFETKADVGSYKMILLFLTGLTKLNDPWTQCVLPTPYLYYEKGSSKAERMCRFSRDQIMWIYESQNAQAMKDLYCNVLYELLLDDPTVDQFALGYVVASAHFKVTQMDMFEFNKRYAFDVDRSMILEGINKVLPSFTLSVRHLKVSTAFRIPSVWYTLIDRILPELERLSFGSRDIDDKFVGPEVPCPLKIFDTIQLSPNLNVLELDFGISRDTL